MEGNKIHALIDCDIPLYEASSIGTDKETGTVHSFEYVEQVFLNKIQEILTAVGAETYTLFLTGKGNFRIDVATVKPYKGNRVNEKPFHYNNLKAYILSFDEGELVEGMEADDALAIAQTEALADGEETVICTRDKDLRQVPGWHYGWEMGLQPEFPMTYVNEIGQIDLIRKFDAEGKVKSSKITGTGSKFFYSQLVTGDPVDNIPGLPRVGAVKAFEVLDECTSILDMYEGVAALYKDKYDDEWEDALNEQAYLLWMVRKLTKEGLPVMWTRPVEEAV